MVPLYITGLISLSSLCVLMKALSLGAVGCICVGCLCWFLSVIVLRL